MKARAQHRPLEAPNPTGPVPAPPGGASCTLGQKRTPPRRWGSSSGPGVGGARRDLGSGAGLGGNGGRASPGLRHAARAASAALSELRAAPGTPDPADTKDPRMPQTQRQVRSRAALPLIWPSGQWVVISGSWGYSEVKMLVTGTCKDEILIPRDIGGHMGVRDCAVLAPCL